MPIYEYKCQGCGKTFERIRKFSDAPLTVHDECGGSVEQQLTAPAFQFKGTGWYVTDYAKGSGGGKPESKPAAESGSESKPAAAESKPVASTTSTSTDAK